MSDTKRKRSYHWGLIAEYLCIGLLLCKGYSILARRYRNPMGEIDIIAVSGKNLVFIEVKARAVKEDALFSITPQKQQRLAQAAHIFVTSRERFLHHGLRFDVMVVTSMWKITHLKDAWRI